MRRRNGQKGFLAIVAVIIVIIVAFIAVTATQQFAANSLSTQGLLRSAQSQYMGLTGLEQARNQIVYHGATCSGYDSGVVNFGTGSAAGQYHVTGTTNVASAVLSAAVNASATTIPISNIVGTITPTNGSINIDNETITYTNYSGGNITGAVRGANGTTAASHTSGTSVSQIECFLTSYSAIPALTTTTGARIFTALLIGTPTCNAFGVLNNGISSWPTLTSGGNVTISGNAIIQNGEVTTSSSNYAGSNVLAAGNIWTVNGSNATTQVSNGSGGWSLQSNKNNGQLNDVVMGSNLFTSATLWNHYFNASPAAVQSHLTQYSDKNAILGLQGVGIWFNGDLHLASTDQIGTAASPVLLIVNGDFQMDGQSQVYGLVYATTAEMQGQSAIYGGLVSPGDVSVGAGQALITQGSGIAKFSCNLSTDIAFTYNPNFAFLHEVFQ